MGYLVVHIARLIPLMSTESLALSGVEWVDTSVTILRRDLPSRFIFDCAREFRSANSRR